MFPPLCMNNKGEEGLYLKDSFARESAGLFRLKKHIFGVLLLKKEGSRGYDGKCLDRGAPR
jgi:hypothetical protein